MEWTVVTVLAALVGLGVAVIKPLVSLTNSITRFSAAVDRLEEKLDDLTGRNSKAHDALFNTLREHDDRLDGHDRALDDHERRITEGEGRYNSCR